MKKVLAEYIMCLSNCLAQTKKANDRPLYEMYLADAGVLLACLEIGANSSELRQKVDTHERLLTNTWISDDAAYKTFYDSWDKFKKLL